MTDETILQAAARIVDGDRERTYGDPGRNLRAIANLWDSWLLARGWSGSGLTTDDVALMMALLKLARLAADPTHRDSLIDLCGYARLIERTQAHDAARGAPVGEPTPHPRGGEPERGRGSHTPQYPPPSRSHVSEATPQDGKPCDVE